MDCLKLQIYKMNVMKTELLIIYAIAIDNWQKFSWSGKP